MEADSVQRLAYAPGFQSFQSFFPFFFQGESPVAPPRRKSLYKKQQMQEASKLDNVPEDQPSEKAEDEEDDEVWEWA